MGRQNMDFAGVDLASGFVEYTGKVNGISEKRLAGDTAPGVRTRLLKLAPGVQTPEAHAHDYWEEIYIISGSMLVATPDGGERRVTAPAYACREPGFMHGPIRTDEQCLMIEFAWRGGKTPGD